MSDKFPTKPAVSISEMARMVGLSRQRFHQLVKAGVFPSPQVGSETRRKFYDQTAQASCLEVRKTNIGVNGKLVLFYAPRKRQKPAQENHADLVAGLRSLGLTSVTASQVEQAVKLLYPKGTKNFDPGEVLRAVFLHLKSKCGE
jgi:hypothetical protein